MKIKLLPLMCAVLLSATACGTPAVTAPAAKESQITYESTVSEKTSDDETAVNKIRELLGKKEFIDLRTTGVSNFSYDSGVPAITNEDTGQTFYKSNDDACKTWDEFVNLVKSVYTAPAADKVIQNAERYYVMNVGGMLYVTEGGKGGTDGDFDKLEIIDRNKNGDILVYVRRKVLGGDGENERAAYIYSISDTNSGYRINSYSNSVVLENFTD